MAGTSTTIATLGIVVGRGGDQVTAYNRRFGQRAPLGATVLAAAEVRTLATAVTSIQDNAPRITWSAVRRAGRPQSN